MSDHSEAVAAITAALDAKRKEFATIAAEAERFQGYANERMVKGHEVEQTIASLQASLELLATDSPAEHPIHDHQA